MADEKRNVREVPRAGTPKVHWNTSDMRSTYANVCNVTCTREEVLLLFGLNQAWSSADEEVTVQLAERVILSPYAAKRLSMLLNNVIQQYEGRFGTLDIGVQTSASSVNN